ncbi:13255_t:CDS:2, partial [Cetraspora pellucida]
SKDQTVPTYYSAEVDDIENFLFDFEGYEKAKKYDKDTLCLQDLKMTIMEKVKAENETEIKINRLKCLKQDEKKSISEYTNQYEAYVQVMRNQLRSNKKRDWYIRSLKDPYKSKFESRYPKNYEKVKKKALKMEEYDKDRALNEHNKSNIARKTPHPSKSDMDLYSIVNGLAALSINQFTEKDSMISSKYLRVELLDENECGDIRVFSKRKRNDNAIEFVKPTVKR